MDEITRWILTLDLQNLSPQEHEWIHALKTLIQRRITQDYIKKQEEVA